LGVTSPTFERASTQLPQGVPGLLRGGRVPRGLPLSEDGSIRGCVRDELLAQRRFYVLECFIGLTGSSGTDTPDRPQSSRHQAWDWSPSQAEEADPFAAKTRGTCHGPGLTPRVIGMGLPRRRCWWHLLQWQPGYPSPAQDYFQDRNLGISRETAHRYTQIRGLKRSLVRATACPWCSQVGQGNVSSRCTRGRPHQSVQGAGLGKPWRPHFGGEVRG
jgi:hypothetical protein